MTTNNALANKTERARARLLKRLLPDEREAARRQLDQLAGATVAAVGVGDIAPAFELRNIHGYRVALEERLNVEPIEGAQSA